jgi:hypothetical protein
MKSSHLVAKGPRSRGLRLGLALVAIAAAGVTAARPPQHDDASSSAQAPQAVRFLPGHIDTVYADPTNVMYSYGPSEAERFSLRANAFTSNITVAYTGFSAEAQAAFQAAVDIWRSVIVSPVPIRVNASFEPLGAGILGSAGPSAICSTNNGLATTAYAAALADKIDGSSFCAALGGQTSEIRARFSSTFSNWDFGTSGVPVSGKYNFLTVVMHELGHGLGFYGSMTASGGIGSFGYGNGFVDIYDRFAVTGGGAPLIGFVNPSATLGAQLVSNNTFFNGTNARANNGSVSPKLETHFFTSPPADNGFQQGSSYSHLDDVLYTGTPNGLMTYALGQAEVYTDPGPIMRGMFTDEGWTIASPSTGPSITSQPASQAIVSGSTATMTVMASGTAPLSYQWYVGASGNTSTPVGANSNSFTTPPLTTTTNYWVRVSNSVSFADSNTATITVVLGPSITLQPVDRIVRAGQDAQFTVAASGTPAPGYQWQVSTNGGSTWSNLTNAPPYSGVMTTTLTVTRATTALNGTRYRAVATNSVSSATSSAALLTVLRGNARSDFDGDGKTDLALFRPSTGIWYIEQSTTNYTTYLAQQWGLTTDRPLNGDYDGDGKADLALYRPSTGIWYVMLSSTNYTSYIAHQWGLSTDIPVPGDYDGDGRTDLGLYRPSTGIWYILQSSTNYTTYIAQQWGLSSDIPVTGDYDGDGKADLGLYRPSTGIWYILQSSTNYTNYVATQWGLSTDITVPGDYDGDGRFDLGLYRPSSGIWYILTSSSNYTNYIATQWGLSTDINVPGDYDGDGRFDLGLYRPSTGIWYILTSSSNYTNYFTSPWGLSTDIALPARP